MRTSRASAGKKFADRDGLVPIDLHGLQRAQPLVVRVVYSCAQEATIQGANVVYALKNVFESMWF